MTDTYVYIPSKMINGDLVMPQISVSLADLPVVAAVFAAAGWDPPSAVLVHRRTTECAPFPFAEEADRG